MDKTRTKFLHTVTRLMVLTVYRITALNAIKVTGISVRQVTILIQLMYLNASLTTNKLVSLIMDNFAIILLIPITGVILFQTKFSLALP